MACHVKIGDTSWCQYSFDMALWEAMWEARVPLSCSYSDRGRAEQLVAALHGRGVAEARIVDGSCDQQDSDDYQED